MACPVVEVPLMEETTVKNVPRPKRPRERVATPAELADEAERCRRAREAHRPLAPKPEPAEANLCGALVCLARWRKCCVCGSETLFVDERGRADADFECGLCQGIRENLAKRLRYVKLAGRVRFHLDALFLTGNDNGEARA